MTDTLTAPRAARPRARIAAQTRLELRLTLRRGESVLLTFAIPILLFAFFASVDVLPIDEDPTGFLFAGLVALAVVSTSMVSLAIATGFERSTRVLKRLGASPLRRGELLVAKTLAILGIEALQIVALTIEALLLGWDADELNVPALAAALVLGTVAFAGIGMLLAGTLPALTTLAAANGLYLLLLLFGGMIVPLDELPGVLRTIAQLLPAGALADACRGALNGGGVPGRAWAVLAGWAVAAPIAAARFFRWE